MEISLVIRSMAYFLALINPASKVFLLSTKEPPYTGRELVSISVRSTVVAFGILALLASSGNFLLIDVFHVKLYSLRIAGGIVLFLVGLNAVRQGRFYEESDLQTVSDITIVPLAAPLIAGPGTITAAISFSSIHGIGITIICITLALIINLIFMLVSHQIGYVLEKISATGPLIRITGLIVTSVAVQMILTGFGEWISEPGIIP